MDISTSEAAGALDSIERVVQRVKRSRIYRQASDFMILWGVLVFMGYALSYAVPRHAGMIWVCVQTTGVAATVALLALKRRGREAAPDLRFAGALLLFFAFGLLWSVVLGTFGPRELAAFWATFFMFGYTVAGLWFGRGFIVLGLGVTALTVAGYFLAPASFDLFMAFADGGGLICCGLWMRRA